MSALSALHGAGSTIFSNLFITLPVPKQGSDLSKQIIIVTGANTGLGLEASRHLLQLGVDKLIMAVRSSAKGEEAKKELLASTGRLEPSIEVWSLDMDSYESIKTFASRASELPRLDGVLANAGVMTNSFSLSEGIEKTLNVNVVSTFLLYLLLLPKMKRSGEETGNICRYVIPNSALHYMAPLAELDPKSQQTIMERLNDPKKANMSGRYPLSKLLVIYAVREFAKKSTSSGKGRCIINTPNPSFCKSNLAREQDSAGFRVFEKVLARSTEEGSRALINGLLEGEESNGQYLTNCHVSKPASHVTGDWGQKVQKSFYNELLGKLETIQPGISSNI